MSKNLHNYSFIFIITIFFLLNRLSCVNEEKRNLQIALDQAGSNKAELKKVIDHYSIDPAEHLKLKAARFLIRNMPYHSYQSGLTKFEAAFDSIAKVPPHDPQQRKLLFEYLLDSISKLPTHDKLKTVRDIEVIDAQFLIENIDLAFEAWNNHPKEKRAGFNTFCNYILPYRNDNVPLEREIRRKYFEKFHWAIDSLQAGVSFKSVADSIFETSNYTGLATIRDFYPIPLTASRYEKCRTGLCSEEVNYIICIFRALGITASEDFVPLFGNSRTVGHSFFRIRYGDEVYCPGDLIDDYKRESIPKVFRKTYSVNRNTWGEICLYIEVTPEYAPVTDVAVDIAFNGPPGRVDPVLCLFQRDVWYRIAKGKQKGDKILFDGIGINVLYLPAYYSSGNLYPVNYPFFILPDKTIHYYEPGEGTLDSVILLRKTGLKTPRADFSRKHWVDSLRYGIFQGANDPSFNDAQLLARITNLNSTHIQTISVINSKPFRYVRFWADNHSSFLSLLEFYDSNTQKLTGKIIKSNTMNFFKWQNGAFDDDPLTYTGGFNFTLGLELDKPGIINHIRFQSRNDDNHIRPGDSYELFYWDKNWRSLGMQTAADTLLTYHKVPENSIFWLRNLSRGREENVFVMDKSGKQVFLGFDEEQ